MKLKNYRTKRPPHIFLDNQIYFLTVRTHRGMNHLLSDRNKQIVLDCINEQIRKFNSSGEACFGGLKPAVPAMDKQASACDDSSKLPVSPDKQALACKNIELYAWSIAHNHYHLLLKTKKGSNLPKFIGAVNGKSSHTINEKDGVVQKTWSNYFDKCIRNEADFYKHLNYIHQNPIKHWLVPDKHATCPEYDRGKACSSKELDKQALACYPFCSYKQYLKSKGQDWLNDCFQKYPIIDFVAYQDEF